jgi:N-acetylglucosamine transport system permease protein
MQHGRARFIAGFLALPVLLYAYYVIWPYLQAVGYSFTNWGGFSDRQEFVGFQNYVNLAKDELVRKAFWHNVFFLVTLPVFTIGLALFLAFLLNVGGRGGRAGIRGVRGSSFYKIVIFFPQVLSVALVAIMWQAIYRGDDQGLVNGLLMKIGLVNESDPINFTANPEPFLGVPAVLWWLLLIAVWAGTGFYMVLFSAAMQSIPKDIFEAALLDGASRIHTFFRVTLPLLRDTVSVAWVYLGFIALDMYALVYVMTPNQGGPNNASEVFATVINFNAFQRGRFGYACAIGVALAIFTLILAAVQLRVTRRERIEY